MGWLLWPIAMEEPEVRDMVAVKYPARKLELPATLPKDSPIDNLGELRDRACQHEKKNPKKFCSLCTLEQLS